MVCFSDATEMLTTWVKVWPPGWGEGTSHMGASEEVESSGKGPGGWGPEAEQGLHVKGHM